MDETEVNGITLYLRGVDLNPDHVTSIIGIAPDVAWRKGDTFGNKPTERKKGLWQLEFPRGILSVPVAVEWFQEQSKSFDGKFLEIGGIDDAEINVVIFLDCADGRNPSALKEHESEINPKTLDWLARSGAYLTFSIFRSVR